jgi:hypothetical protein
MFLLVAHDIIDSELSDKLTHESRDYDSSTTTSSICSITSSIHNSISSLASSFPDECIASSPISFRLPFRQAFHSSTSRLREAVNSALTLLSSAASSSSNARLKSRRFFLICFCFSLLRRLGGLGRQINCLNRS